MKKNLLLIGFVFSLSVNLAALFTVAYNWWSSRERKFQQKPFVLRDFDERLTGPQLEELRNLRRQALAKADSLKQALREQRELLIEELSRPEPNRDRIDEILRDIVQMQFELEKEVIDDLLRLSELLPPKQRERVLNIVKERLRESGRWRTPRRPLTPKAFEGR